jgi:hypothetical protein
MWKSWAIPVAIAASCAASPLAAATTLTVQTSSNIGWTAVTPDAASETTVQSVTRNPAWADVPWISTRSSGTASAPAGTYQYVYTLAQAGLFGTLTGNVFVDNRLQRIFVNGVFANGIDFADLGERQFEGAGRPITFDLSQYGLIQSITFVTLNNGGPEGFSTGTAGLSAPAIPEPGTWMLMILGLGAVGFAMRRRQNASVRLQFA